MFIYFREFYNGSIENILHYYLSLRKIQTFMMRYFMWVCVFFFLNECSRWKNNGRVERDRILLCNPFFFFLFIPITYIRVHRNIYDVHIYNVYIYMQGFLFCSFSIFCLLFLFSFSSSFSFFFMYTYSCTISQLLMVFRNSLALMLVNIHQHICINICTPDSGI